MVMRHAAASAAICRRLPSVRLMVALLPNPAARRRRGPRGGVSRLRRSASRNGACAGRIMRPACSRSKNAALSTSGKLCRRPDRGGHSISKVLLVMFSGSQSPSAAQASTSLPLRYVAAGSGRNGPSGRVPVSSSNSRQAAASSSSSSSTRPLGIDRDAVFAAHVVGAAGVHQQHLKATLATTVEQQSGTHNWHAVIMRDAESEGDSFRRLDHSARAVVRSDGRRRAGWATRSAGW